MNQPRQPAVAGTFYPSVSAQLRNMVEEMLTKAITNNTTNDSPKAIIAPHAGYIYSGPIAASAYATLAEVADRIKRVVLLGPAHRVAFNGVAMSACDSFVTPLGSVSIDHSNDDQLIQLPQVCIYDEAHVTEHSIEVHLPFLQSLFDEFKLIPLVVGNSNAEKVAEVIDLLWGGPETLIVVSTDLSHFHDYQTAQRIDQVTTDAIERMAFEEINFQQACGRLPVSGLLLSARNRGMRVSTLDLRNSGDTTGTHDRVVGYGAYILN